MLYRFLPYRAHRCTAKPSLQPGSMPRLNSASLLHHICGRFLLPYPISLFPSRLYTLVALSDFHWNRRHLLPCAGLPGFCHLWSVSRLSRLAATRRFLPARRDLHFFLPSFYIAFFILAFFIIVDKIFVSTFGLCTDWVFLFIVPRCAINCVCTIRRSEAQRFSGLSSIWFSRFVFHAEHVPHLRLTKWKLTQLQVLKTVSCPPQTHTHRSPCDLLQSRANGAKFHW